MISQFERKHWALICCAIAFSIIVMTTVGLIVAKKHDEGEQLKAQLEQKHVQLQNVREARLAGTNPINEAESEQLPKDQQLDAFILNLDRIEQATGVLIAAMTFSESAIANGVGVPAVAVQKLKQIDFKFNLVAPSKQQWLSFLEQLEQQPRTTIVRTISYARPAEPAVGVTSAYEVEVAVSTFYVLP